MNGSYNFKSVGAETPLMADQCATCGAADVLLFTCGYCDRAFCADHSLPHHSCEGLAHPGERVDEEPFEWPTEERTTADGSEGNGREGAGMGDAFAASGFRPASDAVGEGSPEPRPRGRATPAVERAPRRTGGDAEPAIERAPRRPEGDTVPVVGRLPRTPSGDARPAVECVPRRATGTATDAVRRLPRRMTGPSEPAIRPRPATPDGQPTPAVGRAPSEPAPDPEPEPASSTGGSTAAASTEAEQSVPIRPMDTTRAPGRVDRNDPRTLTEWIDQQTYVSLSVKTAALAAVINGALYLGMMLTMYGLTPV